MKIAGIALLILMTGCATADQRLANKASYRDSQVSIIEAQERARTEREAARAMESAAMWAALAEVVRVDPDSSNMIAMVAAVSAAKGDDGKTEQNMVMLKTEHEATALDWVKVLANPVTNIGIAALNMDLQKTIARQNTLVDLANASNDARMMDTFATLGSRDTSTYNISDEASIDMSVATSGDSTSGDTIMDSYNSTETTTDSYNTTETTTDSYNTTETATTSGDTHTDSYNTTDSSDNSDNSVTDTVAEAPAP